MTAAEHYAAAEKLLEKASQANGSVRAGLLAEAQVHATLALAAATKEEISR